MDVHNSSEFNNGMKFVYVGVDILSKLAFAFAMKKKQNARDI